ncbi:cellulose biosynthesis cyclic di-GMP-binding regulatory protein BcsB, partial [Klebsiella pneumoniae]|uniref:cellulose biosynthesis cyclic di-GMP-binding regulatory protein BcsB n=1 Tax=Klebsiella pneumoniae TaxID=573 RepID=UPI00254D8B72
RLYIVGRTEDELLTAVNGLVIEGQVLSGQQASIKEVNLGAPRKPYDAPRYVPTHRPVRFAELMDYSTQLEATADRPRVRLNLRLPP